MKNILKGLVVLLITILMLSSIVVMADTYEEHPKKMIKSEVTNKPAFASSEDEILFEGFEDGTMPPEDWDHIWNSNNTWDIGYYAHSGTYGAYCPYGLEGDLQNEWLISPPLDFSDWTTIDLSFWWMSSYYWMVELDNFDVLVWIFLDPYGYEEELLWVSGDIGNFTDWIWYNTTFGEPISLDEYAGESYVQIAWQFYGEDTDAFFLDDILITGERKKIESAPILEFVDLKAGLLGILDILNLKVGALGFSVVLKNTGNGTAYNITWKMEISEGGILSSPNTQGDFDFMEPDQKEVITIKPVLAVGKPAFKFTCTYQMELDSSKQMLDAGTRQDYVGLAFLLGTAFPEGLQPDLEWREFNTDTEVDYTIDDEKKCVILTAGWVPDSWKNVQVVDTLGNTVYSTICKFTDGEGIIYENHQTYGNILSGDHWEVEYAP